MVFWIALLFASSLLVGCAQLIDKPDVIDGQYLTLNKPVEILPDTTRRFIQHGKLTTRFAFDRREQHCRIEVRTLSSQSRVIQPDQFLITRVRVDSEAIAMRAQQFASASALNLSLAMVDDGPPERMELIILDLASAHQPDVMRLICAGALSDGNVIDYPRNLRPNLTQINSILADYAVIN